MEKVGECVKLDDGRFVVLHHIVQVVIDKKKDALFIYTSRDEPLKVMCDNTVNSCIQLLDMVNEHW